jgi:hypothetical protein
MSNFVAKITATPTAYGVTAADATAIGALATDFSARLATSSDPSTRTKVAVAQKNTSKLALVAKARQLIKLITAYPPLTAAQRAELGLNPRDVAPTPIPAPATRPLLAVEPDGTCAWSTSRCPRTAASPPASAGPWSSARSPPPPTPRPPPPTTPASPASPPAPAPPSPSPPGINGKTLWVLAQWYNERGELGPVSAVASTTIAA